MEIDEMTIIAYHEASHAVAHYLLRIPFVEVSIIPADDCLGYVKFPSKYIDILDKWRCGDYPINMNVEKKFNSVIMSCFAGNVGEEKYTGIRPDGMSDSDEEIPYMLMSDLSAGPGGETIIGEELFQETKEMLDDPRNWGAVQALAAELLKRKVISGRLARKIIRSSLLE